MLEPQPVTTVLFETSKGALELQLWTKEITCARKFVEKCTTGFSGGLTFSKAVHDDVIEAQAGTIEYDMELESHPRINFSQRGYVGALKDEKTGKFSADGIFITLKEIPTFHKKYIVIGKVTTDTFFTVLKIKEGENEDGKLVYPVCATPISIGGDESRVQAAEPSLVRPKNSQQNAKKTKRRVALDYDEQPDTEVKRVKMKLAHELLKERKEKSEEKGEEESEKNGEKKIQNHEEDSNNGESKVKDEKDENKRNNEGDERKEEEEEKKYNDKKADKRVNEEEQPAESSDELPANKDMLSRKDTTTLHEPKNSDQHKQPFKTSKRRRSFAYNPLLDFDSSDEAPPKNLKTHVFE